MHKYASRKVFRRAGLTVPAFRLRHRGEDPGLPPFPGPLVVKPAREGSSIGLTITRSPGDYESACRTAERYDELILVERYIPGRELTVGVLEESALPVIEIVPKNKFFDFEAKYTRGMTEFILPAPIAPDRYREVQEAALRAHRALGCDAYSRVDIILGEDGRLYVLEVNTIPGFTATSLFPRAAARAGIDFGELCIKLLELALRREGEKVSDKGHRSDPTDPSDNNPAAAPTFQV
jgi:D-alanine-D-alanine ligase